MNRFLSWIRVLRFDYSRITSFPSTFDAVLLACLRCLRFYSFVSVACSCDPTFIAYPHGLPIVRYLDWFFKLVWCLVLCFSRSLCADSADGSSASSSRCLAQCCQGGGFFPQIRVFFLSIVWGFMLLLKEFSRLRLSSLAALVGWPFCSICLSYA